MNILPVATAVTVSASMLFAAEADYDKRLKAAATVFSEIMKTSDKSIPQDLLNKAQCFVIVPGLKKGAFIIGAKFGKGFLSCRNKNGVGWTSPGAIRVEGGSVGFQIGGSETDVIMLVMNERGSQRLMSSKFTIGGDVQAAAGPVGREASAETDAYMTAEILTWSRSRGLFAGISLQGATLRQDLEVNREMYGKTIENREIIEQNPKSPAAAADLLGELNKYSSRK